jgi:hypothetical protein
MRTAKWFADRIAAADPKAGAQLIRDLGRGGGRLNHSERGCHPAIVRCGGRRASPFNHLLRINAQAVLMLSTLP